MSASPFHSFLGTPILFLTVQVRCGLPILGDRKALEILRETWLRSAKRDQWLVGLYQIMPDQVNLLACSGPTARPVADWIVVWKATAAVRIKAVMGGRGSLWESGAKQELVRSAAEYAARCSSLQAGPGHPLEAGVGPASGHWGMQWQILPVGMAAGLAVNAT